MESDAAEQVVSSLQGEGDVDFNAPDLNDGPNASMAASIRENNKDPALANSDDAAFDEGLFIDDGTQEINLKSNSFPAIVIFGAPLQVDNSLPAEPRETLGQLFPIPGASLSVRIRFDDDKHGCHITLRFIYNCFPVNITATVRLPFLALRSCQYGLKDLPADESQQYLQGENLFASERLYQFTINDYDPIHVSAENLFITSDIDGIFSSARAIFESQQHQLGCVIIGTEAVSNAFLAFNTRMAEERELYANQKTSISGWYPEHPTKAKIQAGEYPDALNRPQYPYHEAKHSFFSLGEYITVQGFGTIAEHEFEVEQTEGDHEFDLKLVNIPGCGNRRYIGLLVFPVEVKYRMNPGDRLSINFEPAIDSSAHEWHTIVTNPLPHASAGEVTVLLTRPWDKESLSFKNPAIELKAVDWATAKSEDEAFERVMNAPIHRVLVRFVDSDQHFKRQLNTLRLLPDIVTERPVLVEAILANRPAALPPTDLFGHFRTSSPIIEQNIGLSAEQAQRVGRYRSNEGPIGLLQGPPGTGKTYVACRIALAFIEHPMPMKVMIVSAMNTSVDAATLQLRKAIDDHAQHEGSRPIMVIRLHTLATEIEVSQQKAKKIQPRPVNARPALVDDADLAADLAQSQYAEMIHEFYEANTTAKRPHGIADERLHLIELSLGTWMLKVAGIIEPDGPFRERTRFESFCDLYNQFSRGNLPAADKITFRARAKELREFTMKRADVIACTRSQCADASAHRAYEPTFVVVEEAARAVEIDCIMPMVFYKPSFILLVGDDRQLKPIVLSSNDADRGNNVFAVQLRNSLFTRLHNAGYHCPILNENRRMQREVATLIQELYYRKERLVFITPVQPEPRVANKVKAFNKQQYGKASSFLWIDVPKGRAMVERSRRSKYNTMNAVVGINLAIALLQRHVVDSGDDIVLLAPYHAQYLLLSTAVVSLRRQRPDLNVNGLSVAKIDSYQGSECKITICDLVVDSKIGFMNVMNRLNVGLSRSRCGLYIIGNSGEIGKNSPRTIRNLQALIDYCKEKHQRWAMRGELASPYVREGQMTGNETAVGQVTGSETAAGEVTGSETAVGEVTWSETAAGEVTGNETVMGHTNVQGGGTWSANQGESSAW